MKKWENAKLSNLSICETKTSDEGTIFVKIQKICTSCCHVVSGSSTPLQSEHTGDCPAYLGKVPYVTVDVPANEKHEYCPAS